MPAAAGNKNTHDYGNVARDTEYATPTYVAHIDNARPCAPPYHTVITPPPPSLQQASVQSPNAWAISFCGCCATPAHCCSALFFPCVNAGYAADGIGWRAMLVGLVFCALYAGSIGFSSRQPSTSNSLYNTRYRDTGFSYTVWTTLSFVCALLFVAATAVLRGAVRRFDDIPGSIITDVCASFWCSWCVLSQLSAHTERVKPLRAHIATLPAYHAA